MTSEETTSPIAVVNVEPDEWVAGLEAMRRRRADRWAIPAMSLVVAGWAALVDDWVLAVLFVVVAAGYDRYVASMTAKSARTSWPPPVTVHAATTGVTVETTLIRSQIKWAAVTEVVETPRVLVLARRRRPLVVIPKQPLGPSELQAIRTAHVEAASHTKSD